jgi:hypothetical protein
MIKNRHLHTTFYRTQTTAQLHAYQLQTQAATEHLLLVLSLAVLSAGQKTPSAN